MNNFTPYGYMHEPSCERCRMSDCEKTTRLPLCFSDAMAYVPFQECNDVYPCEKALWAGTVFPVLDKPFLAGCCR